MRTGRVVIAVVVPVAAAGLVLAAATDRGSGASASARVYRDLCATAEAASAGELNAAARQFTNRVHGPLHTLATDTAALDRQAAARLLEAKNAVEVAFDERDAVTEQLTGLVAAARAAVETVDGRDPGAC